MYKNVDGKTQLLSKEEVEELLNISMYIPQTITVRQAREQLIRIGLLSKVQSEIDKIIDITQREIVQNYWEYSMDFKRDNDVLISLAYSLGLSDADIDNLFIEASNL